MFKLIYLGIKLAIANRIAYRFDFFIGVSLMFIYELMLPIFTLLVYSSGATFSGWELNEVLLIQSIFLLSKGIVFPFMYGIVRNTLIKVRNGTFDLLLIKPRSILLMNIITAFDVDDFGKLVAGIVLFSYTIANIPVPSLMQWTQFFILFIFSILLQFSFVLIMSGVLFKWVNIKVHEIFDCIVNFGFYPRNIFSKTFQIIITSIVPVSMLGFFPASILLSKPTEGVFISSIVVTVLFTSCLIFWHLMLKKYTSTGG